VMASVKGWRRLGRWGGNGCGGMGWWTRVGKVLVKLCGGMSSGKGGSSGRYCGVSREGGMDVCVMGRDDGCLLSGGEVVRGRIVLAFFLTGLVNWRLGGF